MTTPRREAAAVAGAAVLAMILVAAAFAGEPLPLAVPALALAGLAGWIVREDAARLEIPDGAVVALALLGFALRVADAGAGWMTAFLLAALDGVLCGGGLWLLREGFYRRRGVDGIGLGDVKLAAAGGVLAGTADFALALLAASLAGIAVLALRRRRGAATIGADGDKLAFGVLLAPLVVAAWLGRRAGWLF